MGYLLGIDGGGTKTTAILSDQNGKVLAEATAGPTNLHSASKAQVERTLKGLWQALKGNKQKIKVSHVFAGVAGTANIQNQEWVLHCLRDLLSPPATIKVVPDPINALYSGTYGEPGIVQICGTGSITYGINQQSQHDRTGGWGYLLGDEGSGYDIGRQGAMAALKAYDGRGMNTSLTKMFFEYFRVTHPQEFLQRIYASPSPKNELASLSKLVFQAYKEKDTVAEKIIFQAADEMVLSIATLYNKLFHGTEKINLVLAGGIFSDKIIFPKILEKELADFPLSIILPILTPVAGSLIGAYNMKEEQINETFIENINQTFMIERR
ncbi:hypothetical protein D8M04_07240 [Oceanobacillus piezotolerans]|uniref:ATPase BadF/BadG/BcrA/BcrD type domain-containing protein n=1 Tax=Oceanobacillus piezotolerans TaxID=2448030 RepID=A0A498DE90_9BACI|nr:BadF/BadG/BcrA/BcrD ATPase family protein [Oceanobacillus piezotolerans]RLL46980.1 hypothetical protein D8M04_07240 [Oceanobacillus piezotolerans]